MFTDYYGKQPHHNTQPNSGTIVSKLLTAYGCYAEKPRHGSICVNPEVGMGLEMRLVNGVVVSVSDEDGQKVLKFDQLVRVLALDPVEASHIGASLYRSKRITLLPHMIRLVDSGFFGTPRAFKEVSTELDRLNLKVTSGTVTMCLSALVRKHVLSRTGKRRHYAYVSAIPLISVTSETPRNRS